MTVGWPTNPVNMRKPVVVHQNLYHVHSLSQKWTLREESGKLHWMVISNESDHFWTREGTLMQEMAQDTLHW